MKHSFFKANVFWHRKHTMLPFLHISSGMAILLCWLKGFNLPFVDLIFYMPLFYFLNKHQPPLKLKNLWKTRQPEGQKFCQKLAFSLTPRYLSDPHYFDLSNNYSWMLANCGWILSNFYCLQGITLSSDIFVFHFKYWKQKGGVFAKS